MPSAQAASAQAAIRCVMTITLIEKMLPGVTLPHKQKAAAANKTEHI